jgi:CubicO group peptidase (beta-lactamase class C family)
MAAAGGYFGGHIAFPKRELGDAYDRALNQLVFKPLGMRATTPDFRKALAGNHAAGHAPDVDGNMCV